MEFDNDVKIVEKIEEQLRKWEDLVWEQKRIANNMQLWLEELKTINNADIQNSIRRNISPCVGQILDGFHVFGKREETVKRCLEDLISCRTAYVYASPEVMCGKLEDLDEFII